MEKIIQNQQEDEDGYPTIYQLEELEPAPDSFDPFSGRKLWIFENDVHIWAFSYKNAVDIHDYVHNSQSFSL